MKVPALGSGKFANPGGLKSVALIDNKVAEFIVKGRQHDVDVQGSEFVYRQKFFKDKINSKWVCVTLNTNIEFKIFFYISSDTLYEIIVKQLLLPITKFYFACSS